MDGEEEVVPGTDSDGMSVSTEENGDSEEKDDHDDDDDEDDGDENDDWNKEMDQDRGENNQGLLLNGELDLRRSDNEGGG